MSGPRGRIETAETVAADARRYRALRYVLDAKGYDAYEQLGDLIFTWRGGGFGGPGIDERKITDEVLDKVADRVGL